MGWEIWVLITVLTLVIIGLAYEVAGADVLCLSGLAVILLLSEVARFYGWKTTFPRAEEAVRDFGSSGLITIALLFVVVSGLIQTGALTPITSRLLRRPRNARDAQLKLLIPVATISAVLNNTPVVAMFMPVCDDMSKKGNISPSKLFMPMAFCATLGGVCTMIGTSTNLVVNDALGAAGLPRFGMWDITWIGLPCAVVGVIYLMIFSNWLLPDRKPPISLSDDPRQYTVEVVVEPHGPLVGQSIEAAGLRHLPGLYLVEIERADEILPAVSPRERLLANDRLVFVGILESVVDLRKIRGLRLATDQVFKLETPNHQRTLIEAVVSTRCPLVGKTIREGRFRSHYNAAVIAVARAGQRLTGKIGDIVLQPGDTLLLESDQEFLRQHRNSNDFYLISGVENSAPPRHEMGWRALTILIAMIAGTTFLGVDIMVCSLVAALAMLATRCITISEARQSIDWQVLITIGAASGLSRAIESTGLAKFITQALIQFVGPNPHLQLGMIYFIGLLLTELITNNAAARLMFPLALATAQELQVAPTPFAVAIMLSASLGFATPFGYQTHLMVCGPGGYRFMDYVRLGVPLDILMMLVSVMLIPWIWPF